MRPHGRCLHVEAVDGHGLAIGDGHHQELVAGPHRPAGHARRPSMLARPASELTTPVAARRVVARRCRTRGTRWPGPHAADHDRAPVPVHAAPRARTHRRRTSRDASGRQRVGGRVVGGRRGATRSRRRRRRSAPPGRSTPQARPSGRDSGDGASFRQRCSSKDQAAPSASGSSLRPPHTIELVVGGHHHVAGAAGDRVPAGARPTGRPSGTAAGFVGPLVTGSTSSSSCSAIAAGHAGDDREHRRGTASSTRPRRRRRQRHWTDLGHRGLGRLGVGAELVDHVVVRHGRPPPVGFEGARAPAATWVPTEDALTSIASATSR